MVAATTTPPLAGFTRRINACTACKLYEGCTQGVPGRGRIPTPLLLVGEGPGFNEDRHGLPFIGAAGRVLDEVLAGAGLQRKHVYVTNVVRHRPPGNRTPTPKEVRACLPFLLEEIEAVRPEIIVALGGTAFKAVSAAKEAMTRSRGALQMPSAAVAAINPEIRVLGTYHPAAYLHKESASIKQAIIDDLREAVRLIREGREERRLPEHNRTLLMPGYTADDLEAALTPLADCAEVAADCEWTMATDREIAWPWTPNAELFSVSFSGWTGEDITSVAIAWPPSAAAQRVLESWCGGRRFIFHNAMADLIWLYDTSLPIKLAGDTMVLAYLLNEEQSLKLEPLARSYAGLPEWKSSLWEERPANREDWERLLTYNSQDTYSTLALNESLLDRAAALEPDERKAVGRLYNRLMLPCIPLFVKIAHRGMPLGLGKVRAAIVEQEALLNDRCDKLATRYKVTKTVTDVTAEDVLDEQGLTVRYKSGKRKGEVKTKTVKTQRRGTAQATREEAMRLANSPKQIKAFFKREYRLDLEKTDKGVMSHLALDYPAADLIQQIKAIRKLLGTYLRPWAELLHETEDGRLHSVYSVTGSRTGRTTARTEKGGSVQLAPRATWLRQMFAVTQGRELLVPDLSQIELRMIAWLAPEPTMLRLFQEGRDLHRHTAAFVKTGRRNPTPEELAGVTEDERFSAKRINFGYSYGMQAKKYRDQAWNEYRIVMSLDEAAAQRDAYMTLYSGIPRWHNRVERVDFQRGYTLTPFGQKRRNLPSVEAAINAPIQTTGTQLGMLAMIEIDRIFEEHPEWEAEIVGFIHDSIEIEGPDDPARLAQIKAVIKQQMEHPPTWKLGVDEIPVPIEADVLSGPNWGDAHK